MSAIEPTLIRKLEKLPPQLLAQVEEFVDFVTARERRAAAAARLGEALEKLDALNLAPISDEEIAAEIHAAYQERTAQRGKSATIRATARA